MEENRLDALKDAYESIPVPPELEFRVRTSIAQAKQAQKKEQTIPMKTRHFWKNFGTAAAAAMLTIVILANSGAGVASAMEKIPVLGAITRVVTFRTYDDTQGGASAHVEVPQVEGGGQELNDAISAYTDTIIAQYKADAEEMGEGNYNLDLSYETVTDNDAVFALRFNKTLIMASGSEEVMIYDVDKASGKLLALQDLFRSGSDYQTVLTEEIQSQMRQRMEEDDMLTYWLDDPETDSWNFKQLSADANFYFDADGQLVIVFDEGEVAPMFMGVQEFTIPTEVISSIALNAYFPA